MPVEVVAKDGQKKYISASEHLSRHARADSLTWSPDEPMLIRDKLAVDGGWIPRHGDTSFNLYCPPTIKLGRAKGAGRWIDHVMRLYPDDGEHIIDWFAFKVQHPGVKINHALVLGSADHGIGKDLIIAPVRLAVGTWNFKEANPTQVMGRFTPFLKAVILRVSEIRDVSDNSARQFYDHIKDKLAAPPEMLLVDEKNIKEHYIENIVGVIFTTNNKTNGLYLPPEDRRHYVAWSLLTKEDFEPKYFESLGSYYGDGGDEDVAAFLHERDLSEFNPKAPPLQTDAFWEIVNANRAPEESGISAVLSAMGTPDAVTLAMIAAYDKGKGDGDVAAWIKDKNNKRRIQAPMEKSGYVVVRNSTKDGKWEVEGERLVIYARCNLPVADRVKAASKLNKKSLK